jgi:hypothetical protein
MNLNNMLERIEDIRERQQDLKARFVSATVAERRRMMPELRALQSEFAAWERENDFGSPWLN